MKAGSTGTSLNGRILKRYRKPTQEVRQLRLRLSKFGVPANVSRSMTVQEMRDALIAYHQLTTREKIISPTEPSTVKRR
jgi:hypothetical protein